MYGAGLKDRLWLNWLELLVDFVIEGSNSATTIHGFFPNNIKVIFKLISRKKADKAIAKIIMKKTMTNKSTQNRK